MGSRVRMIIAFVAETFLKELMKSVLAKPVKTIPRIIIKMRFFSS